MGHIPKKFLKGKKSFIANLSSEAGTNRVGSFGVFPTNISFNGQDKGESVVLVVRRHPAVFIPQYFLILVLFIAQFGLYMVGFRIFALLFAQLDSMLIGAWIGTAAVTFYIVPQQVAQVVHGINGKMMQVVFPMASEFSAKNDAQRMERLFVRGFNLSLVIGFAIALPLAVVGGPLLTYWVSPEMAKNSTLVLELLIVTFFLSGLTAMPTNILCGINHPKYVTIGAMVSGLLGLALYFLLIKPFGIAGVAAGKALSVAITVIYYLVICHSKSGYSVRSVALDSLRTFGLAVAVGLPAYFFLAPLTRNLFEVFMLASVVGLTYCAACWWFGAIDSAEKRSLKAVAVRFAPKAFAP